MSVAAVYADGGVVLVNPSPHAGTWAACHVDADGWRVAEFSGVLLPAITGGPVSNNDAEFYAVLRGLAPLPDGWSGTVYSDSQNAIDRFARLAAWRDIPATLPVEFVRIARYELDRLGALAFVRLKGHPKKRTLRRADRHGLVMDDLGRLASVHQDWCDRRCTVEAQRFLLPTIRAERPQTKEAV